jgi:hypothetical protein
MWKVPDFFSCDDAIKNAYITMMTSQGVIAVAHCGKDAIFMPRGATSLETKPDVVSLWTTDLIPALEMLSTFQGVAFECSIKMAAQLSRDILLACKVTSLRVCHHNPHIPAWLVSNKMLHDLDPESAIWLPGESQTMFLYDGPCAHYSADKRVVYTRPNYIV